MPLDLTVVESDHPITITFDDILTYHGPGFPGGAAHAFAAMRAAFPLLDGGAPLERREVTIRTSFGGPGGRDAMEMVTRAHVDGRLDIVPDLAEPWRGILRNYVWEFGYRDASVRVHVVDDGIVTEEFIELGKKDDRTEAEDAHLARLKLEMTERINTRAPEDVYVVI